MEKLQRKKSIKKAVCFAIYNKYRFEHYGVCFALIGVFYIEFLPCLHFPSIWDYSVCLRINALISQLLLAYIASYIFLYLDVLKKEQKKYEDYYPYIIKLLKNLFGVFDSRKEYLKHLYKEVNKETSFIYNAVSIHIIIEHLKDRERVYREQFGIEIDSHYTPSNALMGSNHFTSGQISYVIDMLNLFDVLDSNFKMALFRISQNQFIIKLKDEPIHNLRYYGLFVNDEIKLYEEIENLRKEASILFGVTF